MGRNYEQCPLCGARADVMEGVFDFDESGIPALIDGPIWTRLLLQRIATADKTLVRITPAQASQIRATATWARVQLDEGSDSATVKEAVDTVLATHAPAWKAVFDALLSTRAINLYQLLGFILMLLVFFGLDPASNSEDKPEPPEISVDQLHELLEEYLDESGTGSGTPTPSPRGSEDPTPEPEPTQEA